MPSGISVTDGRQGGEPRRLNTSDSHEKTLFLGMREHRQHSAPLTELRLPAAQRALRPALPHPVPATRAVPGGRRTLSLPAAIIAATATAAAAAADIGGQSRFLVGALVAAFLACRFNLGAPDAALALSAIGTPHAGVATGLGAARRRRRRRRRRLDLGLRRRLCLDGTGRTASLCGGRPGGNGSCCRRRRRPRCRARCCRCRR